MKKYDVYGIGNALVDLVFEVEDSFLEANGVEKGLMTLVDENRQQELIDAIELSEDMMAGGGSAANSIVAVSQFGGKSYYSCKVGNDDLGKFYLADLKNNGVDTKLTEKTASAGLTGRCLVMTTPDAERTMNTFLGITSDFSENEIDEDALKNSSYIYSEGYLVTSPTGIVAMKKGMKLAKENGVKVALSFSDPSMVKFFRDQMLDVVADGVDLLFCNEEEAMLFTEKDNLEDAKSALKSTAKQFVITLGADGALVFDGTDYIEVAAHSTTAIDTNGAGDMFAGAFLYGITAGMSHDEAGRLASMASSKIVSQFGPRLTKDEAKDIFSQFDK